MASALDSIPGVGPARRKALLKHFGSVDKIRSATMEELMAVKGISADVAESIKASLE
jgi:excinuclease ABC subunit C